MAGRGEVRVRVLASSVQYTDVLIRRRLYPQTMHRRPPFVMGYDVVGVKGGELMVGFRCSCVIAGLLQFDSMAGQREGIGGLGK